ncbi:DNA repair protein REV1 isoform X2 [Camellia sinensis]|uniref:DNA repair protein REV1 isoform X2 n=1 Tax=Camellia sinensis TaxID=4442 RepID=UPI0010368A0E|nr:DNA repair protein REV1 isoform X2 [Camellia sinensis]
MSFDSSRSANSGSKSKRSFNSISSNPSTNTNNGNNNNTNKKKKTTQKTLGVAWGSNSRSSSLSSFRNSPFSDFGSYMAVKNQKLQEQFDAEASSSSNSGSTSGKPIFQGVSIFVDGFTVPPSQELRSYMLRHGGRLENYFSRHRVTHVICSNLPDSKIKNLRSFSGGLPVVKPAWVLDSVAANKLLSWVPYQLDQIASEAHNQPKLSAFFALKNSPVLNDTVTCVNGQIKPETEHPSLEGGTIKEAHLSGGSMEHSRPCSGEWDDGVHGNSTGTVIEEPTCNDGKYSEGKTVEPIIHKSSAGIEDQASPSRPSASVSSHNTKRSISSAVVGPSKPQHSTLVDPNFVENYFKSSRLHFIGTWRSRYRKRFPSFKYTVPDVKVSSLRTSVIHVDMDSFFVSVVIRNHPELRDKPVAVCHSDNPRGTAEISSANYPARDYGVRAGIFVRNAKALCPHLVILPYDFEAYEQVADQFYNILHKHCSKVQAVSCDEAFLDVTESEVEDSQLLASVIRKEIFEATGCTASAGIAGNLLMARLATRAAKPDGQFYIPPEKVDDYLHELPIKALPGIGHVLEEKLKVRHIQTCGQLRMISKESLQKDFGIRTGDMLWKYSRGIDDRLVGMVQESKSVGAEVNWGVRFNDLKDCQHFLMNLCKEVSLRLQGCTVQGRCFTLKIKKRRNDAEPVKYMGCGDCENLSHSITVPMATDDVELIQRITTQLFGSFHIDVKDIRGVGLQVSKLESVDPAKQGQMCTVSPSIQIGTNPSNAEAPVNQDLALPPLDDLDLGVIEGLPPDLFSEINDMYDGKLINLISKKKGKNVDASNSLCTMHQERVQVAINEGKGPFWLDPACVNESPVEDKEENCPVENNQGEPASEGPSNSVFFTSVPNKIDLMPSSLSQVDISVLQQLPEELRVDILEVLPAHRRPECTSDAALGPTSKSEESPCLKCPENRLGSMNSVSRNELWVGNPPEWVEKFKDSNCSILKFLADMYYRSGSRGRLSSILQCTLSESELHSDASNDGWDDAIGCLCDLLKQYIKRQIETDIEEIYVCFRLLRRFTTKSKFFFQVYNVVLPHLQASVGENYGGSLHISDGSE